MRVVILLLAFVCFGDNQKKIVESEKVVTSPKELKGSSSYDVIWSVPFQSCLKTETNMSAVLRNSGVLVNQGDTFQGDQIATFYTLGLYPSIETQGDVNGGIPQLADLNSHLNQAKRDIEDVIQDANFSGLALIDWESWRPVWETNFGSLTVYRNRSIEYVRQQHPDWPLKNLTEEASKQWDRSARDFMGSTLSLAKSLRPKAKWCFYGFPDCYNYNGKDETQEFFCSGSIMQGNDKLQWMWDMSTALCPSLYARNSQFTQWNLTQRSLYSFGRLQEALRVGGYGKPVYPYINYYMIDAMKTLPLLDFGRLLGQPASLGMSGVVIWGASNNVRTKADCQLLGQYVDQVVAPTVLMLKNRTELCSSNYCNGHAKCAWTKPTAYEAWTMLIQDEEKIDSANLVCLSKPTQ